MNAQIDNKTRKAVYQRDHYRCALCDSDRGLQIHHAVHRSMGGTSYPHNLITLCWRCHAAAHGTRFPDAPEWIQKQDFDQACVEYLSDLYANFGLAWNPWEKELDRITR